MRDRPESGTKIRRPLLFEVSVAVLPFATPIRLRL
jgi:hypothetical protein